MSRQALPQRAVRQVTEQERPEQELAEQDHAAECEVSMIHPLAVQQASDTLPAQVATDQAAAFLKLVADPTRLRLLSALRHTELCVCDLAAVIGLSESAVSHQLRLLRAGRVVTYRKEGRMAYYRLLDQHVTVLIQNALEHVSE